jgi:hypothetical protein
MSEPLSILLHAAARGARLQKNYGYANGGWRPVGWFNLDHYNCRIDPKDRLLRYGPISRVLFEAAKNPVKHFYASGSGYEESAAESCFSFCTSQEAIDYAVNRTKEQRSFFLLLVAEALAHEGL